MADEVWPLAADTKVRLGTSNSTGWELNGFTRKDESGYQFATRWYVFFGLPIVPLSRYYLREVDPTAQLNAMTPEYHFAGQSRLRFDEIVRTYLACWVIAPLVIVGPILLWLGNMDQVTDWMAEDATWPYYVLVGGFVFWLLASIGVLLFTLHHYRARWAPIREVRWGDAPR